MCKREFILLDDVIDREILLFFQKRNKVIILNFVNLINENLINVMMLGDDLLRLFKKLMDKDGLVVQILENMILIGVDILFSFLFSYNMVFYVYMVFV